MIFEILLKVGFLPVSLASAGFERPLHT